MTLDIRPHIEFARSVARTVARHCGIEPEEAEAIGLLALVETARRWTGQGAFRGWAYFAIRNAIHDEARAYRTQRGYETRYHLEASTTLPAPQEATARVLEAVRSLAAVEPLGAVVALRRGLLGETYEEVAAELGRAKTTLVRAERAAVEAARAAA